MKYFFCFILFFLFFSCNKSNKEHIIDVYRDTSFIVERTIPDKTFATCKIIGEIDEQALIILTQPDLPQSQVIEKKILLKKGKIDLLTSKSDVYSNSLNIHYIHNNVKNGKLTIFVDF